jgi:hypothetical protein
MVDLNNCGIIIYDVPDSLKNFANYLRQKLRANGALPVNLSVYMVNWPDVPRLEKIINDARKAYNQDIFEALQNTDNRMTRPLRVNILKFDNETSDRARQMAYEGLSFFIGEIHMSLKNRIQKMSKNGEDELPRRVQVTFARKLEEVYQMATAFRLMDDVEVAYEAMREAIVAQIGAKVASKYLKIETQAGITKPEQQELIQS